MELISDVLIKNGLLFAFVIVGAMMWISYYASHHLTRGRLHGSAVAIILVFILHVYAAIWTRGTIRAMTRGTVTGGWAWRHHRKWLRELAGRAGESKPD